MSIEDYVYWGGVVQGAGLAEYVKNFRRRMFDSAAAVFWMYNDCWPATRSWTIVDNYLRRTPAFWPVRRAFAPVTVVVTREGDRVNVYGVNEGPLWTGKLLCGVMALAGGYPVEQTIEVALPANASKVLAEFDAHRWDKLGVDRHVAFAILSADGWEVARDALFLPFFKEMKWPTARVNVKVAGGKAIFTSNTFACGAVSTATVSGRCPIASSMFIPVFRPCSTGPPGSVARACCVSATNRSCGIWPERGAVPDSDGD